MKVSHDYRRVLLLVLVLAVLVAVGVVVRQKYVKVRQQSALVANATPYKIELVTPRLNDVIRKVSMGGTTARYELIGTLVPPMEIGKNTLLTGYFTFKNDPSNQTMLVNIGSLTNAVEIGEDTASFPIQQIVINA